MDFYILLITQFFVFRETLMRRFWGRVGKTSKKTVEVQWGDIQMVIGDISHSFTYFSSILLILDGSSEYVKREVNLKKKQIQRLMVTNALNSLNDSFHTQHVLSYHIIQVNTIMSSVALHVSSHGRKSDNGIYNHATYLNHRAASGYEHSDFFYCTSRADMNQCTQCPLS